MAKYLVDTFYTCTLKVTHFLDNISEKELENLEKREDGKFEILDIKIDKRKQLTYKEWKIDNCSLSEHEWMGFD